MLPLEERLALQAEITELLERLHADFPDDRTKHSQGYLGRRLGVSQQVINKIIRYGEVGPAVADDICAALRTTRRDLVRKHAPKLGPGLTRELFEEGITMLIADGAGSEAEVKTAARQVSNTTPPPRTAYGWARIIEQRIRDNRAHDGGLPRPDVEPVQIRFDDADLDYPTRAIAVAEASFHCETPAEALLIQRAADILRASDPYGVHRFDPGQKHWAKRLLDIKNELVRHGRQKVPGRKVPAVRREPKAEPKD